MDILWIKVTFTVPRVYLNEIKYSLLSFMIGMCLSIWQASNCKETHKYLILNFVNW